MQTYTLAMAVNATTLVTLSTILFAIRTMPSRLGVDWWIVAALAQAASYVISIEPTYVREVASVQNLFLALKLLAHFGLSIGVLQFFGYHTSLKYHVALLLGTILLVSGLLRTDYAFLAMYIMATYNALNMWFTSVCLFTPNVDGGDDMAGRELVAVICGLIGLYWLDYPFLRHVESLAPIGFAIGLLLASILFVYLTLCALLQFRQVTKQSELEAIKAATTDSLTNVYSRHYLDTLFSEYQEWADKEEKVFALIYFDLDGFKAVNDEYGHEAGDVLLSVVAKRLKNFLGDKGDIVRLGGDEFAIFANFRSHPEEKQVRTLAEKILLIIEKPIFDGRNTYHVSASLGVCKYPDHGLRLEMLLSLADKLMYVAKKTPGKNIHYALQVNQQETSERLLAVPSSTEC